MILANHLNHIVYNLCSLEQIVSLLYAHYSATTGVLTYVNAGHDAALLLHSGRGGASLLDLGGPVLGLRASSTYNEGSVRLRPGDRVIAFTTGLMEALGCPMGCEPERSAEAALLAIARDYQDADSRDLAGAILNRIAYTSGEESSWDRSLVVVSRTQTVACESRSRAEERELVAVH